MPTREATSPVIIITGATKGIGLALSKAFARSSYRVAMNYGHDEPAAQAAKNEVENIGGAVLLVKANVTHSNDVDAMVKMVQVKWGRIDVLIHNAGVSRDVPIHKMTDAEWRDVMATHLDGGFYCARAVIPIMRRQKSGHILNISSYLTRNITRGVANYAAAKSGLATLTRSIAVEEGRFGIRANILLPGFHLTDMNRAAWNRYEKIIRDQHLLGTLPDREELGNFVVNLVQTPNLTGQEFSFESRI